MFEFESGSGHDVQHYVIKFVSDLRQVGGFPVSSTDKTDLLDITEIFLKVALNTTRPNQTKIEKYVMVINLHTF